MNLPEMPFSNDAEKGVLTSILLVPTHTLAVARSQLTKNSFYIPAHQVVYDLVCELSDDSKPVDFVLLRQTLKDRNQLEEIGGVEYLDELYRFAPTAANVNHYVKIVHEKELLRQVIVGCHEAIALGADGNADFDDTRNKIEQILTALSCSTQIKEATFSELILDWYSGLPERYERLNRDGFHFGIQIVDEALGPARPGEYIVISALTNRGKSLFAYQGAIYAAMQGLPVAAFNFEMSDEQLIDRIASHVLQVSMNSFRDGRFTRQEIERLKKVDSLRQLPFYPAHTRGNDIGAVASKLRQLKARHGIKVALVDYLQQVYPTKTRKDSARYLEVAGISSRLKSLALELDLVMIAPCQLNKEGGTFEASSIEHDADIHLKIQEEDPEDTNPVRAIELIVAKNRQGRRSYAIPDLEMVGEFMTLRERTPLHPPTPAQTHDIP
jgi:replicative DNA helicase